jgi:hypothetical protein
MKPALPAHALLAVLMAIGQWCASADDAGHGMVRIPARQMLVGTSAVEREALAQQFDCHFTWLGDDLPQQQVHLPGFGCYWDSVNGGFTTVAHVSNGR